VRIKHIDIKHILDIKSMIAERFETTRVTRIWLEPAATLWVLSLDRLWDVLVSIMAEVSSIIGRLEIKSKRDPFG
jgi:hypothetical protein